MKTLILTVLTFISAVTVTLSTKESVIAADAKTGTPGSIYACWNPLCTPPSGTASIVLKNVNSDIPLGSCELTPERTCCRIDGDFQTGTYFFEYTMPNSDTPCTSPTFSYTNDKRYQNISSAIARKKIKEF